MGLLMEKTVSRRAYLLLSVLVLLGTIWYVWLVRNYPGSGVYIKWPDGLIKGVPLEIGLRARIDN